MRGALVGTPPGGSRGCRSLLYAGGWSEGQTMSEQADLLRRSAEQRAGPEGSRLATVGEAIRAAIAAEREACASAVEHYGYGQVQPAVEHLLSTLAAAIRARGAA